MYIQYNTSHQMIRKNKPRDNQNMRKKINNILEMAFEFNYVICTQLSEPFILVYNGDIIQV